jgi:dinuclear metal center YbgI/SA1388 family protein
LAGGTYKKLTLKAPKKKRVLRTNTPMKVKDLFFLIDSFSPFFLQKEFDNSGIQFGDLNEEVKKILVSLDLTREVAEEALKNDANLIITHHPPIFFPLKKIIRNENSSLFKAITNKINLISAHTNFDLANGGLNDYVANLLSITKLEPIEESDEKIYKFVVYVPKDFAEKVRKAIFEAGAGKIGNYSETSFNMEGKGTFKPLEGSKPFMGKKGIRTEVNEIKIETVVSERFINDTINAMKKAHPYEEPAYDIYEIKGNKSEGIGLIGKTAKALTLNKYAIFVKEKLNAKNIRLIKSNERKIKRVALCTGAGASLLSRVNNKNVDVFITGDIDYHKALCAKEMGLNIIEIDHFETEKFFIDAMIQKLIVLGINKTVIIKSKSQKSPYEIL